MDKLLLTLTLVPFSSGVLCNAQLDLANAIIRNSDQIVNNTENVYSAPTSRIHIINPDEFVFCNGAVELINRTSKAYKANECCMGKPSLKLHHGSTQWNEARESCQREGGQLAVINSDDEATMMSNWMARENIQRSWIGIHDLFKQGHWMTLTGQMLEAAGYNYWLRGEPNNYRGIEHCGSFAYTRPGI